MATSVAALGRRAQDIPAGNGRGVVTVDPTPKTPISRRRAVGLRPLGYGGQVSHCETWTLLESNRSESRRSSLLDDLADSRVNGFGCAQFLSALGAEFVKPARTRQERLFESSHG
jgi:hypothetical protein